MSLPREIGEKSNFPETANSETFPAKIFGEAVTPEDRGGYGRPKSARSARYPSARAGGHLHNVFTHPSLFHLSYSGMRPRFIVPRSEMGRNSLGGNSLAAEIGKIDRVTNFTSLTHTYARTTRELDYFLGFR